MQRNVLRIGSLVVLPALAGLLVPGCGGGGLPSSQTVTLPDGTTQTVTMGSGVISLADTEWDFFYVSGNAQGRAFVRISFDENGSLAAFDNNEIAAEVFGATILFDGARHNTTQPSVQYAATTYGAETSDSTGFAFKGVLKAYAAGIMVAEATATATAEFDPDDPNVVYGEFEFSAEVSSLVSSVANVSAEDLNQEFSFMGRKVIAE